MTSLLADDVCCVLFKYTHFGTHIFCECHLRNNLLHLIIRKNAFGETKDDTRYGKSSLPRLCHLCHLRVSDIEEDKEEDFLTTIESS